MVGRSKGGGGNGGIWGERWRELSLLCPFLVWANSIVKVGSFCRMSFLVLGFREEDEDDNCRK